MARPPAISMHRARGASVPSRRRCIRRPGPARLAAARRPGPRCPRARRRRPLCPGPRRRPRSPPAARRAPTPGSASSGPRHPPACPGMHVNLEKVAGAPARTSAAGRGRPQPSALSFSSGTKVHRGAGGGRGGRVLRATLWRGPVFDPGKPEPGGERRGAGPGKWGLAVRYGGAILQLSRPAELRDMAPLCPLPFPRVKEGSAFNPGLRPMAEGLCAPRHHRAALAASRRVPPARAGRRPARPGHDRFQRDSRGR